MSTSFKLHVQYLLLSIYLSIYHIIMIYDYKKIWLWSCFEANPGCVYMCVRWFTQPMCEANVSRHLAGPKVTLAVTDQSGLAE